VAFVRSEVRNGRTAYLVVESVRVKGKRHPTLRTLLYLGEEPDLEKHITAATLRLRVLRLLRRRYDVLGERVQKTTRWRDIEDPDLIALAARTHAETRLFIRTLSAAVDEEMAEVTAHLARLRDVRKTLGQGRRQ